MNLFSASLQVVALVIAIVCLISAILGRSFGIGPVQVPAPPQLLPRAALATLGLVLMIAAFVPSLAGPLSGIFTRPQSDAFVTDNVAFKKVLLTPHVSTAEVRLEADDMYANHPSADNRCLTLQELIDAFPNEVDVFPQSILTDAAKYASNSPDTQALRSCAVQLAMVSKLAATNVGKIAAPKIQVRQSPARQADAVASRPTPAINTTGGLTQETAQRVLTALTIPTDQGWMFIGVRDPNAPVLIADRRIADRTIPSSGVVATIADAELLDTDDPQKSLGHVKGYVHAGAAVEILRTSVVYANNSASGENVYALVRIVSVPQRSVAAATPGLTSPAPPSPSATPVVPGATPAPTPSPNVAGRFGKCPDLPAPSPMLFVYCNETYPQVFNGYKFQAYKVRDSHNTGIHFRNLGPHPAYLSIYPRCGDISACPSVKNAVLPPAPSANDAGNDFIYTASTLQPFNFGWTVSLESQPS